MSDCELMPMDINDLENWGELFSMAVRGINDHLDNDKPDTHYVISTLLALERQFEVLLKDVSAEWMRMAHDEAVRELADMEKEAAV